MKLTAINPTTNTVQDPLSRTIIGMAMNIHSSLSYGFLENVYHQSLLVELKNARIPFETEKKIEVFYKNTPVGYYNTDLLVDNRLIIEIKAVQTLVTSHEVQLVHYLTATNIESGLLLNFGSPSLQFKRKFKHRKT